jgi:hypothetical protein
MADATRTAPQRPSRLQRRATLLLRLVAIALIFAGWLLLNLDGGYFRDALAYWRPDFHDLYGGGRVGVQSTYLYSPAFAQVMAVFGLLPWAVFAGLWSAACLVALVWMAGPILAAVLFLVPGSPVVDEISTGNIHLLLAAAIVVALRGAGASRAAWALPLLTKVTPGVGVLWHAGARQWRALVVVAGVTAAIVLVSFAMGPNLWFEWFDTLSRSTAVPIDPNIGVIPGPLWARVLLATVVAFVGGALGWKWLAVVAATMALPVTWSSGLSMLVGVVPFVGPRVAAFARARGMRATPRSERGANPVRHASADVDSSQR